jgi:hypothetical protein
MMDIVLTEGNQDPSQRTCEMREELELCPKAALRTSSPKRGNRLLSVCKIPGKAHAPCCRSCARRARSQYFHDVMKAKKKDTKNFSHEFCDGSPRSSAKSFDISL